MVQVKDFYWQNFFSHLVRLSFSVTPITLTALSIGLTAYVVTTQDVLETNDGNFLTGLLVFSPYFPGLIYFGLYS